MSSPLMDDRSTPREEPRILDHLRSYQTHITPARAREILDTQNWQRQRQISPNWVRDLKMAILKKELTFLTIVFAEMPDGTKRLVDGQHRLTALSELEAALPATIIVHRVLTEAELGELYLKYDRSKARGPEVGLRALGVFEESDVPEKFVRRMGGAVSIIRAGFSPSYRQDRSLVERTNAVREWLPEIALYHTALAGVGNATVNKFLRSAVGAVALVTLKYQQGPAEVFWQRAASQEMLAIDDPRRQLMRWLIESTASRKKFNTGEILYCRYVATAWNAFLQGRTLKLLKVADTSSPVRIAGTPYQGQEAP